MLIGNFGRRYQGKTTLAVATLEGECDRRAYLDPRGSIRRRGSVIVRTKDHLRVAFDALAAGDVLELAYFPLEEHDDAFEAFSRELRRWVVEYRDIPLGVLVDEATFYRSGRLDTYADFMYFVKSCELADHHLVITSHRPADLAVPVRALMNQWAIFYTVQEHDLEVIKKRCTAEVLALVQELPPLAYIEWNDDDASYIEHPAATAYIWRTDLAPADAPPSSMLVLQ